MTRVLAAATLFALLAAPAAAATPTQITVTAEGRSNTLPDMASAAFTISTNASDAAAATSDNNSRYERLLHAFSGLGIAQGDVRTTSFNMNYNAPPAPPDTPQPGQRYGYFVYRGVSVTIRRLALVGKTVDAALASGVTDLNGVAFDTSDGAGQFARALSDAVKRARAHAEAMAGAAGLHVVRVRSMQEGAPSRPVPMMEAAVFRAAPNAVPTQIQPSSVETTATVTITYDAQ